MMRHELIVDDLPFCLETHQQTGATELSNLSPEWHVLNLSAKLFAIRVAIIASTGGLLFGYDIGVVEGALPQLRDEMHLSDSEQDLVVSVMVVGAIAGAIVSGYLTDGLGRWLTIVLMDFTFIGGGAFLFFARTTDMILIGRFIVGAAVAISAVADVSYLAELAPRSTRGAMVSANELAISLGVLASFLAGHLLRRVPGGWRYMFGLSAVLATAQLIGMMFMPRSPRWLFSKGKHAEAKAVLVQIRSSQEEIDAELFQMDSTEKESTGGVGELVKAWGTPLAITTSLAILQQLTGNGNILNYTAAIFHMAKVNGPAPVVMLGVVKVLATMVAILKVDDMGRKPFLFWGAVSFTACLVLLSLSFAQEWSTLSFIACCGLVAAYALSFGPVTWLVTAEMFPAGLRGKALGIGQVGSFVGSLVASSFFLRLLHHAGGVMTFTLFTVISCGTVAFIAMAVPETKNKEPMEIAAELPGCGYCCPYSELRESSHDHIPLN